jgi:hypothetical protein
VALSRPDPRENDIHYSHVRVSLRGLNTRIDDQRPIKALRTKLLGSSQGWLEELVFMKDTKAMYDHIGL